MPNPLATVAGYRLSVAVTLSAGVLWSGTDSPKLSLHPRVVALHERATAVIGGWAGSRLAVALLGATDANGRALGWRRARRIGTRWTVELPAPALLGVYPVLLRGPHGSVIRSPEWMLRVFRRGTSREPSFATPQQVVRWWVVTKVHATVAALRSWRLPGFDKRDPTLNRLFVVAYNPRARQGVRNRLGMFIAVVRDGYHGRWRLLEATVKP